jgi:hypothetical protein
MAAKKIRTMPNWFARGAAVAGDLLGKLGYSNFPFNSFRLNNILTQYRFDLTNTEAVCGELPYCVDDGVAETVAWLNESVFSASD